MNKFVKENLVMSNPKDIYRLLDIDGNLIDKKNDTTLSKDELVKAYKFMVLSRQQDNYMTQLQRQGRMLTFAPNFGEEALQVASAMALEKGDYFVPAFRSNASMLYLGVPMKNQYLYWNGNERGSKIPEGVNVLPVNIPIASQFSHAAGIAYGMKLTGHKNVAVSFIGNGGTAEGEFYEALNTSAIHKWPAIFCVNNNQWSISTPEHLESPTETVAIKAAAVGIPGILVDGNDLLASYEVMKEAAEYARSGKGPILIEFFTWRQGPHTTSDNPRVYRTEEMEKEKEKWEPMHRIEKYMLDRKYITKEEIEKIWEESMEFAKQEFQASLEEIDVNLDEVFDYTYEKLTPELVEQKAEAVKYYADKGAK
ncbi:pyruvate dehydrogenase (acetyl-transferring) E1 component subunit alpha [Candidatus Mycoplasma pogonae]